jgi:HPt (histidine-containing phosphotransfer) domain-containing protein
MEFDARETSLPEIAGVDSAAGMAGVGGSHRLYRKLLRTFLGDAKARFALLEKDPDNAVLPSFITCVHGLKSGLANIGAQALSESAAVLEQAGRDGDITAIGNTLPSFREELAALTARIDAATACPSGAGADRESAGLLKDADGLGPSRSEGKDAGGGAGGQGPPMEFREALAELQTALEARDADGADSALERLHHLPLSQETRAALDAIAHQTLFGDFRKAAAAVKSLKDADGPSPRRP